MRVEVTAEHIKRGRPRSTCECPIARALEPYLASGERVAVGADKAVVLDRDGEVLRKGSLPHSARSFIGQVDADMPATPFAFDFEWEWDVPA